MGTRKRNRNKKIQKDFGAIRTKYTTNYTQKNYLENVLD